MTLLQEQDLDAETVGCDSERESGRTNVDPRTQVMVISPCSRYCNLEFTLEILQKS